ncbi:hypothetical protein CV_0427 [Chromobacterium violaceum ATCC 12472]|uniref:Uncharacterized protein n=1 Tax=Chromobacterium violaceum (strain ATCC 12472 / DSM 30191 / JCM 1249 / CCUG 213 / NBRC 12614 / NCIMB 9131 / NCTC 9757 / MK) TaxID=243365 RepID=Q7P0Y8_CHRVO|nr:hypothetical protein CV_0427 [Chromobacterium violaceum ATCC 12472]
MRGPQMGREQWQRNGRGEKSVGVHSHTQHGQWANTAAQGGLRHHRLKTSLSSLPYAFGMAINRKRRDTSIMLRVLEEGHGQAP